MEIIEEAYRFAKKCHSNQKDDCGNPYFDSHILQVFNILKQVTDDKDIICAGLLHDVIEDCDISHKKLSEMFNQNIADLVYEVTHEGKKDNHGFYLPRLKSRDAILIKFADRLSNLSRMEYWEDRRKKQYLRKSKFWRSE